jgi:hypothetical protein
MGAEISTFMMASRMRLGAPEYASRELINAAVRNLRGKLSTRASSCTRTRSVSAQCAWTKATLAGGTITFSVLPVATSA